MRIVSWNTNGIRATYNQGFWTPFLKKTRPDIICLQETKAEVSQLPPELQTPKGWFAYFVWSKIKKGHAGVAIFSKIKPEKIEEGIGIPEFDNEGRILVAYYKDFVLINCYFPNGGGGPIRVDYKLRFYDAFLTFIETLKKKGLHVIFCGDVNTAHREIDLARPKENVENTGFLPIERAWMDKLVAHGWVDIFRYFYPTKKDVYTYWDQKSGARARNVGWRIDYFFTATSYLTKIQKCTIVPEVRGSDHCPVVLTVKEGK